VGEPTTGEYKGFINCQSKHSVVKKSDTIPLEMLHLLGTPRFLDQAIPLERTTLLVTILACANDWQNRETVMTLLWEDAPLETAQTRLRQLIYRAGHFACFAGIESERRRLRFTAPSDVAAFRHALRQARWQEAADLYGGTLLEGYTPPDEPELEAWLTQERATLEQEYIHAVQQACKVENADTALRLLLTATQKLPLEEGLLQHLLELGSAIDPAAARAAWSRHLQALTVLGEEPSLELQHLAEGMPSPNQPQAVLPVVEPLIGRHAELEQLNRLWKHGARLVTLLGLGGIGKTHLAIEAARREPHAYFVSLVTVQHAEDVASAILEAFGVAPQHPKQQLQKILGNKQGVLLLDNFEHVLPAAALVAEILVHTPHLRILVTSRERLGLQQEHLLEVQGLPNPDDLFPLELQDSASLFVRAAKRIEPRFELKAADLAYFTQIHRLVSGSPLGLHLAASWVRVLSLEQIQSELSQSLELLHTRAADVPLRHRSLQAVFASSWERLSAQEQHIVACLSLLRGQFDLEVARFVSGANLPTFLGLVDKSLISKHQNEFFLHEAIRQYATEQLKPSERDDVLHRLLERFAVFAQTALAGMCGTDDTKNLMQTNRELEHLRVCVEWGIEHEPQTAAQIVCHLLHYLVRSTGLNDATAWLESIHNKPLGKWRLWVKWARGYCFNRHTRFDLAIEYASAALASQEELLLMLAHRTLSSSYNEQIKYELANQHDTLALEYAERLGHPMQIDILAEHGITLAWQNHPDQAFALLRRSQAAAKRFNSSYGQASVLFGMATLHGHQGNYIAERELLLEAREWYIKHHDLKNLGYTLGYLGSNAVRLGNHSEARAILDEARSILEQTGTQHLQIYLLSDYAHLEFRQQQYERAALLIYACLHLLEQSHAKYDWFFQAVQLEPYLDTNTRARLAQQAQHLTLEQALDFAKVPNHSATMQLNRLPPIRGQPPATREPS
jgi:predicted ATPase/DNA-binding SARP family transcriptional activator